MRVLPSRDLAKRFESAFKEEVTFDETIAGTPIFEDEDIMKVTDTLSRMTRAILVRKGITTQYLLMRLRGYMIDVLDADPTTIPSAYGNLLKGLRRDHVTFKTFIKTFVYVLGYKFDIDMSLEDENGVVDSYNYHDISLGSTDAKHLLKRSST